MSTNQIERENEARRAGRICLRCGCFVGKHGRRADPNFGEELGDDYCVVCCGDPKPPAHVH